MKYSYKLTKSRRKTLSLSVRPDLTIEVKAPLKTSQDEIDRFVNMHSDWIEKNLIAMQERKSKQDAFQIDYGCEVYFFGKKIPVIESSVKKAKLTDSCVLMPHFENKEKIKDALIGLYKETARAYILSKLSFFAAQIGVTPTKLTISSARTNWGSCTADRVHFSWHLIMAEKEVIDYVIIHELVHIIHHNHSEKFWSEVSRHCPQWKTLRARLKFYSEIISVQNW